MDNNIRLHWEVGAPTFLVFLWQVTVWGIRSSAVVVRVTSGPCLTQTNTNIQDRWLEKAGILVVMYKVSDIIRHGVAGEGRPCFIYCFCSFDIFYFLYPPPV